MINSVITYKEENRSVKRASKRNTHFLKKVNTPYIQK